MRPQPPPYIATKTGPREKTPGARRQSRKPGRDAIRDNGGQTVERLFRSFRAKRPHEADAAQISAAQLESPDRQADYHRLPKPRDPAQQNQQMPRLRIIDARRRDRREQPADITIGRDAPQPTRDSGPPHADEGRGRKVLKTGRPPEQRRQLAILAIERSRRGDTPHGQPRPPRREISFTQARAYRIGRARRAYRPEVTQRNRHAPNVPRSAPRQMGDVFGYELGPAPGRGRGHPAIKLGFYDPLSAHRDSPGRISTATAAPIAPIPLDAPRGATPRPMPQPSTTPAIHGSTRDRSHYSRAEKLNTRPPLDRYRVVTAAAPGAVTRYVSGACRGRRAATVAD